MTMPPRPRRLEQLATAGIAWLCNPAATAVGATGAFSGRVVEFALVSNTQHADLRLLRHEPVERDVPRSSERDDEFAQIETLYGIGYRYKEQ